MAQVEKQLGDVLLEQGIVTLEQLRMAADEEARTGESAWRILLQNGTLSERDLIRARATQIGLSFVDVQVEEPTAMHFSWFRRSSRDVRSYYRCVSRTGASSSRWLSPRTTWHWTR